MSSLSKETIPELLSRHVAAMEELRARGVLRSANNPTGDLAEYLFCAAFGWAQEDNSAKAFDAADAEGYVTKLRVVECIAATGLGSSRQFGRSTDLTSLRRFCSTTTTP